MTFLTETRKINLTNENNQHELQLLIHKYYNSQNQIVSNYKKIKHYDNYIKRELIKNKINILRKNIKKFGKNFITLIDNYYFIIPDFISQSISKNETHDFKILKRDYDKNKRIQAEISLAKRLNKELSNKKMD